ncbi:MAG: hypothetical protein EPO11_10485 [Gammaproteobacteria bacterium]|nr:MAG: hypothetical protein EPO11_10485 [Gammaproteobacteria bacterium]
MKKIIFLLFIAIALTACANSAEQVMPPVHYNDSITFHIPKKAYIYWELGEQYSSTAPQNMGGPGLSGLAAAFIEAEEHQNNPSKYTYTYGKAQQAVFMTSLEDVFSDNHVFNNVELITDLKQVHSQDVLMKIYFKSTRVASYENNYQITLDVDMSIEVNRKLVFHRTYVVQSDNDKYFSTFKDQQTNVSQKLLVDIVKGVKQWHTNAN